MEKDKGQYNDAVEIFWASGACLFMRSELFWKAGALDEDFFAHQEEIDLCWRLKNMGYKIIAVPTSVVYHVGGGSLSYGNPRKTYLNFRNNLTMMLKNLPASELWKIPFRFVLDFVALIQSIIKEKGYSTAIAIHKAHLHFCLAIPDTLKKREKIAAKRKGLLYPKSVVWQHFALGKNYYTEL